MFLPLKVPFTRLGGAPTGVGSGVGVGIGVGSGVGVGIGAGVSDVSRILRVLLDTGSVLL